MLHNWFAQYIPLGLKSDNKYISLQELFEKGIRIDKEPIACGKFGCVRAACQIVSGTERCDAVIKIGKIGVNELSMTRYASEIGVGPKVLSIFSVHTFIKDAFEDYYSMEPNTDEKGKPLRNETFCIVMERYELSFDAYCKTKGLKFEQNPAALMHKLMNLYSACKKYGFIHGDLHYGNMLIRDNKDGNFDVVLADFGFSFTIDPQTDTAANYVTLDWLTILSYFPGELTESIIYQLAICTRQSSDLHAFWKFLFDQYNPVFNSKIIFRNKEVFLPLRADVQAKSWPAK